jgi:hypothetical protein
VKINCEPFAECQKTQALAEEPRRSVKLAEREVHDGLPSLHVVARAQEGKPRALAYYNLSFIEIATWHPFSTKMAYQQLANVGPPAFFRIPIKSAKRCQPEGVEYLADPCESLHGWQSRASQATARRK